RDLVGDLVFVDERDRLRARVRAVDTDEGHLAADARGDARHGGRLLFAWPAGRGPEVQHYRLASNLRQVESPASAQVRQAHGASRMIELDEAGAHRDAGLVAGRP